jgi:hypothetical protein
MRKIALIASILAIALAGTACKNMTSQAPTSSMTEPGKYYAVLLSNGSVYFGQLEGLGTQWPVLKDVYYVQSNVNQDTKAVSNSLVKRGKEWHGPDRMIINEKSIVFVEPVGKDSRVSLLIEESKK